MEIFDKRLVALIIIIVMIGFIVAINFLPTQMYVISFYSLGAGIDRTAIQALDDFLNKNYPMLEFQLQSSGLEGERDYCIDLSSLSEQQQVTFKVEAAKILASSSLVTISEKKSC